MSRDPLSAGEQAPDFRLDGVGGQTVCLSDFRGRKAVVLAFLRGFQ